MIASLATVVLAGSVAALWVGVILIAIWRMDLTACPDCGRRADSDRTVWTHDADTGASTFTTCSNQSFHPPP